MKNQFRYMEMMCMAMPSGGNDTPDGHLSLCM